MGRWQHLVPPGSFRIPVRDFRYVLLISIFLIILMGCNSVNPTLNPIQATIVPTKLKTIVAPTQTSLPINPSQPPPSPSPTQASHRIWLPPYLPGALRDAIVIPDGYVLASIPEEAEIKLQLGQDEFPASQWIYTLVAPFPTITDGVTSQELQRAWKGDTATPFNGAPLLMDESTLGVFTAYWGIPAPQAVQVLPGDELLEYTWSNRPSWAIVPFEELHPRWKALTIDGQSPVRKDFDPSRYPLSIPFVLSGDMNLKPEALSLPSTNRDSTKLTTLVMTGVTAMVRGTASTMEQKGITYPSLDIGSILADADITHISNEIPFSPDCPYPSPQSTSLVFCSSPRYIELLKAVGTDIVELTGDHFMDYGAKATLDTIQIYADLGWKYYGGGANAEQARQPVLLENNGNRFAFLGCNVGCQLKNEIPCDAIATDDHPGAAQCDYKWLSTEIPDLREQGYQVIFTFQHREYYTYTTEPILAYDFGQIAAAGATIVSGSQAHQPNGFAFEDGSYIHYGLGNLFFDQYHFCASYACDDAFIDRHVFYAGRYISTELITIHFVDLARPRLMTATERARFLELIFKASGW